MQKMFSCRRIEISVIFRVFYLFLFSAPLLSTPGQAVFIRGVKSKVINTVIDCHVLPIFLDLSFTL